MKKGGGKISHITYLRTNIKNPNRNIAGLAFRKLIEKYKAKATNEVVDFYGNRVKVDFGLAMKHGNLGIIISDVVEFVGDRFMLGDIFEEAQRDFKKYYISIAVTETLKAMGYEVVGKELKNGILIDARR